MCELLSPEAVVSAMEAHSKKDVLNELSRLASACADVDSHAVFDVLWERERLGTTGVGHGIAIPHGRLSGLDHVVGLFARLAVPVSFESIDEKPVDLVFLLLAPEDAGADHLHALATVSRRMRDPLLCEQLRRARDENAIYRLLTEAPTARAA